MLSFNQVVRGSNPRCLMERKTAENLVKSRLSAVFYNVKSKPLWTKIDGYKCLNFVLLTPLGTKMSLFCPHKAIAFMITSSVFSFFSTTWL